MAFAVSGTPQQFKFADGNAGHLCTNADGGTAENTWDVLFVNSNTTVSTPSGDGFSLAEAAVTNQGAYVFTRKAGVGGAGANVTITTSGNHNTSVIWVRLSGADALDLAESAQVNASAGTTGPAFTSSALAEAGEYALAFIAMHNIGSVPHPVTPVWGAGYATVLAGTSQGDGVTGVSAFVGFKTPVGTAAESPTVSWTNTAANRYILFVTFTAEDTIQGTLSGQLPAPQSTIEALFTARVPVGGWQSLINIAREAILGLAMERAAVPRACPNDGEPLRQGPDNTLYCPYDGWQYPRDHVVI